MSIRQHLKSYAKSYEKAHMKWWDVPVKFLNAASIKFGTNILTRGPPRELLVTDRTLI